MIHCYRFISEHHAVYGVARLCRFLAVKRRQGYLRHEALCLYSLLSGERLEEHLWV